MEKYYFKTAEFAALCGVKKDTLFHYDRIGLLKPAYIGENGYRYYSARQLASYDLIAALRHLGTPLKEIRDYLNHRSPEGLLALLREKQEEISAEQKRLERMSALLENTVKEVELSRQVAPGIIRLEELPASTCAVVKAPAFTRFSEPDYLLSIRSLLSFARENGSTSLLPGDIILQESLQQGKLLEDLYFCRVPDDTGNWETHTRPAGLYAVLYHRGSYETQQESTLRLLNWVREQGYLIDGNLYEEDLISYAGTEDPNGYMLRLCLKIRFAEDAAASESDLKQP